MTDTHPGGRASMIFLTTVVLPDPVPPAIPIIYMLRVFVDRLSLPVRRVSPCHGAASVLYQCKVSGFSPHAVWPQGGNSCVRRCGQLIYIKKSAENGEKMLARLLQYSSNYLHLHSENESRGFRLKAQSAVWLLERKI